MDLRIKNYELSRRQLEVKKVKLKEQMPIK